MTSGILERGRKGAKGERKDTRIRVAPEIALVVNKVVPGTF